jgi:hypothetical protein
MCVSVALCIQYAKSMRLILLSFVACPPVPCFYTLAHKRHDFREQCYWTQNTCFGFHHTFVWQISHSKKKKARYYHKYTYSYVFMQSFLSDFSQTWIFSSNFKKNSNIKFHENPSSGNRVGSCGKMDGWKDRETWCSWLSLFVIFRKQIKMCSRTSEPR